MSTRTLALCALLLAVLLAVLVAIGLQRFGHFADPTPPGWEFRNVLLDCKPGTVAELIPGRVDHPRQQFWFLRVFPEPDPDDLSVIHSPVARYAHIRAAVSQQRPQEEGWYYQTASLLAFRQLGAVGSLEWLKEIGPVRERSEDGEERDLLRATFANTAGAEIYYAYDPAESREQASRRGLGWVHMIQQARGITAEVYFLEPAGFREPPPPRPAKPK